MSILIIGSEGAQGKRYQAILKLIGEPFARYDEKAPKDAPGIAAIPRWSDYSRFIIVTPTDTHAAIIRTLLPYGKPILCEKPVTKNIYEMRDLYEEIKRANVPFTMVYQYRQLGLDPSAVGHSYYNYFRHGNDGLIWDCLQIIGQAKQEIHLEEYSPVWQCEINGEKLNLSSMDMAYVIEIRRWLNGQGMSDLEEILRVHEKVNRLYEKQCAQTLRK